MSNLTLAQASKLALSLGIADEPEQLVQTLKATAFKGPATDAQLAALLIVASAYGLNPWTKEIYAFPDKNGGIVPVVGVDGWARIINTHGQFDGMEFAQDADSCTCKIYRKDRAHPTSITEYMVECRRSNVGPWMTHPYRMLRHKAMIQCARISFGFVGIHDQDEAERIIEAIDATTGEVVPAMPAARPRRASEAAQPAPPELTDDRAAQTAAVLQPVATPAATPVPAAEPAQAHRQAPDATTGNVATTGEPASAGECMNVIVTAKARKVNLAALLEQHGLSTLSPDNLAGLTKAGFKILKGAM